MKRKSKTVAVLTVFDGPKMSISGRMALVRWLERQAKFLQFNNRELAKRWTVRYLY